jgi:hypothetical protein
MIHYASGGKERQSCRGAAKGSKGHERSPKVRKGPQVSVILDQIFPRAVRILDLFHAFSAAFFRVARHDGVIRDL